jgi:adenylosuccinate lyase
VIARYQLPEMAGLFTDQARMSRWLEIELLATEAWAQLGVVPIADAEACRVRAPSVDESFVAAVDERERVTDHDVAAFVDVVQDRIGGSAASWIHFGLTSSDVVDTAQSWALRDAADLLVEASAGLVTTLKQRAIEHRDTAMVGRTHGVHAEPTTFGAKVALWALQAERDRVRLLAAREAVAVGKLSGAVGTYSNIDPAVERHVCDALGLQAVPSTQVIARDRHAQYLYACASVGATIELIATEVRHLQRTEVREAEEGFRAGQKGSSAMPHKRNPITAERLTGLARILRGNLQAGLEDVALWHERDISHSSAERVVIPDAFLAVDYMLDRFAWLLEGLVVRTERMRENLDASHRLYFSQRLLLALVDSGLGRDEAYRLVQRHAMRAWDEGLDFPELVRDDAEIAGRTDLEVVFDLAAYTRNAGVVFERLQALRREHAHA